MPKPPFPMAQARQADASYFPSKLSLLFVNIWRHPTTPSSRAQGNKLEAVRYCQYEHNTGLGECRPRLTIQFNGKNIFAGSCCLFFSPPCIQWKILCSSDTYLISQPLQVRMLSEAEPFWALSHTCGAVDTVVHRLLCPFSPAAKLK